MHQHILTVWFFQAFQTSGKKNISKTRLGFYFNTLSLSSLGFSFFISWKKKVSFIVSNQLGK